MQTQIADNAVTKQPLAAPDGSSWLFNGDVRPALLIGTLGFVGLAVSCLASVVYRFGGSQSLFGPLTQYDSLPAELFGWAFFTIALLLVLRVVIARGSESQFVASVACCIVGAALQCASAGCAVRYAVLLAKHHSSASPEAVQLLKVELALAAMGWFLISAGILIARVAWRRRDLVASAGVSASTLSANRVWGRALLCLTIAFFLSFLGAGYEYLTVVNNWYSSLQQDLLFSYVPQVLSWLAVFCAAIVVARAARQNAVGRSLRLPATIAASGALVLFVSTAALLATLELIYQFVQYGLEANVSRLEAVTALGGMLVLAGACLLAIIRSSDLTGGRGAAKVDGEGATTSQGIWPSLPLPDVSTMRRS